MKYPVRCRIVDAELVGHHVGPYEARTPPQSKPHIGKHGLAELIEGTHVRIALDDGTVLGGEDCWWEPEEVSRGA